VAIHVRDAKTEAGVRQINLTPWLHDELLAYRASRPKTSRAFDALMADAVPSAGRS
jgi:hypothetical protein